MRDREQFLILPTNSIQDTMLQIDRNTKGIALVVDETKHLLGTITDGDIRRAILNSIPLDTPIHKLLAQKANSPYPKPVTASVHASPSELLQIMQERRIRQVPLLDDEGRVAGLVTLDEVLPDQRLPLQAVIMAGGFGTRLRPLTEDLPKPMLPIGGRPLMERIIEQLQMVGIRQAYVTTHYKPEKIVEYFGDGSSFGIHLDYVNEAQPLGTGGALGLMPEPQEPLLVINGDILTQVDFGAMLTYHVEHQAEMTVGVRQFAMQVPYGVIECDGPYVQALKEKPHLQFLVNAGIYLLEPTVHQYIPKEQHFNMTDLIQVLLDRGQTVVSFPIHEYWLDIGQHGDYTRAQEDMREGKCA